MLIAKFDKAASNYIASLKIARKSELTVRKYQYIISDFRKHIPAHGIGSLSRDVSESMVVDYKNSLVEQNLSSNTIAQYLIGIRSFFKWSIEHKFFSFQPVSNFIIPELKEVEHDIPTIDEILLLLSHDSPGRMWAKNAARNKAIVETLLLSGIRVSELCSLKICDCDFKLGTIRVKCGKGNKSRFAPFPSQVQKDVMVYLHEKEMMSKKLIEPFAPLFTNDSGDPFSRQGISRIVEMYVKRLTGHSGITSHDLRHAAASLWDDNGLSPRTVQKALGHSNIRTTEKIYIQILNPSKAAREISRVFSSSQYTENPSGKRIAI